jgi:hypothetical protein
MPLRFAARHAPVEMREIFIHSGKNNQGNLSGAMKVSFWA